jgi:chromosome segregation ATPase
MDWGTLLIAVLTSAAFNGLVIYLIEIRPRKRQAEAIADRSAAEARKTDAEARKTNAEADNQTLDGAFRLIDVLTKQIACNEQDIDQLKAELQDVRDEQAKDKRRIGKLEGLLKASYQRIEQLMQGIYRLLAQIRDMGAQPCWEPDEWEPKDTGC